MRGSIRLRGNTYTAYWETRDPATGKRRQHTKGGYKTKGAAQKHLNIVIGKVTEGSWTPDQPLTVAQLLREHWLPAMRSRGLRPATLSQYAGAIDWWIVPQIGGRRTAALTPNDISALVEHMRTDTSAKGRKGLSARSTQVAVVTLKSATAWATRNGLLGRDPLVGVDAPRREGAAMKSWGVEEAREFLTFVRGDRLEAAWALFLTLPLRRGEVAGLRWDQVNLAERRLQITRTRITVDGAALESTPKTAAGKRTVPLDDRLVALLRENGKAQKIAPLGGSGHVFTDELGRPWHPDFFTDRFAELVAASGLPRIRLHDTRHTVCSLMIASGVSPKVVQELAGHASVTITMNLYVHTMPSMGREAGEELSASLLG